MRLKKLISILSVFLVCVLLMATVPQALQPCLAADPAATAMALFNAKRYKEAMPLFRKAIQAKPRDSKLYYYFALCQQYSGDLPGARKTYMSIIKYFPGSEAAMHAGGLIGVLERQGIGDNSSTTTTTAPVPAASPTTPSTGGTAPATATPKTSAPKAHASSMVVPGIPAHSGLAGTGTVTSPDECNLRFERVNNALILDVMVNNRPTKMMFDTGAENCCFGKNHLQELSIRPPTGPPTGKAGGVGNGGVQDTWELPVSLTIGPITRKDFGVSVQNEMMGQPLLGETFFQDFSYTIDNGANNIHVVRKSRQSGSIYQQRDDPYAVPFTRMGNEIIVQAEVNGKSCPVIFDTGASVCAFTYEQIQKLGISVPEDARTGQTQGIAGMATTSIFPIRSIKLGPIEKRDFDIHVLADAKLPAPLLGQTFYGDWQYTIDYEKKVIHFLRR